jgi:hypothetical protein
MREAYSAVDRNLGKKSAADIAILGIKPEVVGRACGRTVLLGFTSFSATAIT